MNVRTWRVLSIITFATIAASCGVFSPSDTSTVTIEGQVYGGFVNNPAGGPVIYVNPVSGAVVSTSLDSATASTDASGRFTLVTQTGPAKDYGCKPYTVTITAAGLPTYSLKGVWGSSPKDQVFTLSPPQPNVVGIGIPPC